MTGQRGAALRAFQEYASGTMAWAPGMHECIRQQPEGSSPTRHRARAAEAMESRFLPRPTDTCRRSRREDIGKPCTGKSHARFDEGRQVKAYPLRYPFFTPTFSSFLTIFFSQAYAVARVVLNRYVFGGGTENSRNGYSRCYPKSIKIRKSKELPLKKIALGILCSLFLVLSIFSGSAWSACDPNENCTRAGPYVPCPTWSEPLRTCPSYYNDPVCDARRLACGGQLAVCVTAGMVGYTTTSACIGCLVAAIAGTGGGTAAGCAPGCGISAALAEKVVQNCQ